MHDEIRMNDWYEKLSGIEKRMVNTLDRIIIQYELNYNKLSDEEKILQYCISSNEVFTKQIYLSVLMSKYFLIPVKSKDFINKNIEIWAKQVLLDFNNHSTTRWDLDLFG